MIVQLVMQKKKASHFLIVMLVNQHLSARHHLNLFNVDNHYTWFSFSNHYNHIALVLGALMQSDTEAPGQGVSEAAETSSRASSLISSSREYKLFPCV